MRKIMILVFTELSQGQSLIARIAKRADDATTTLNVTQDGRQPVTIREEIL